MSGDAGASGLTRSECIPFEGYIGARGYGWVTFQGRQMGAHRREWIKAFGPVPEGLQIHHTCGNRICVNLEHLEALTSQQHNTRHQQERTTCRRGHPRSEFGRLERGCVWRCRKCHGELG